MPAVEPQATDATAPSGEQVMTVTVRDRSAEPPWGHGLTRVAVRTATISAFCPLDGQRRGQPKRVHQCEDGIHYWVDCWSNPCGHVDYYTDVLEQAAQSGGLGAVIMR